MSSENVIHSTETAAVLACIQGLLGGLPGNDPAKMLAHCHPLGGVARMRDGQLVVETIETLIKSIADIPGLKEENFIDIEVRIHEDLAMVWAKNEVKVDGKVISVGYNAISLHKMAGDWKITSISDTAAAPAS